jgi:ADP-heptose:LPS heptosyltransferase
MKKVIISPCSRKLRNGKRNPKDYPYWFELVLLLKNKNIYVIQIGTVGENKIEGVDEFIIGKPLKELEKLIKECNVWISVDNFFQHFAWLNNKQGIVLFGQSDPEIFGHKENINLLKSREYLRNNPFDIWENAEYKEEVFVDTNEILLAINKILGNKGDVHA